MSRTSRPTLEAIIALCKRRGFVYPSAEIYGGLNGVYDFGHLGTLMKQNIKQAWISSLFATHKDILLFDGAILSHQETFTASGHVDGFKDPMIDCTNCKHRYRADDIDIKKGCPHCGKKAWTDVRQFNMMFQTQLGAAQDKSSVSYLRPETAQSIFINFKNVTTTNRVKIPFGIAQIGKAFRNEITPKQFLFRVREFEQMELEWFCKPTQAPADFTYWVDNRYAFLLSLGINKDRLKKHEQTADERAHYAANTTDIEYEYPFGWKELEGIANRTDYDLKKHTEHSGKDLQVYDDETKSSYIPYVIESSIGVDRLFLTLLFDSYKEEKINNEERVVLSLSPKIAPIKAAFFPLSKKLNEPMLKIYRQAQKLGYMLEFDDAGSIGKRYRRQDEIGTPACFTYDFESEQDNCVTVRDRDTTQQKRMPIDQICAYLTELMNNGK